MFTDTTAPYEMSGSSTSTADGPHTLAARAQYSSGPARTSATTDITVNNGLNTQQRLQVDLATDAIDLDQFTEYGVKGLLNQDAIPARYQSTAEASVDPTQGMLSYLGNGWESLSSGQKADIESFAAGSTTAAAADPSCLDDVVVLEVFELEFPEMCVYDTGDFRVFYKVGGSGGVDPADSGGTHGGNGIPNYIDRMVANLDVAREKYVETLGYELASGTTPLPVLVLPVENGFASPFADDGLGHFIVVETSDEGEDYTARHELFHIAQYSYTSLYDLGTFLADFGDFIDDRESTMWWLEASANWAAHQAALTDDDPNGDEDKVLAYASLLRRLFGAPANYFSAFDSVVELDLDDAGASRSNSRAYGSFIFAEWLQQQYGNDFLLDIWEGIGQGGGDGREASEVIEDLLVDEETTIEDDLPRFWLANYLFADDSGLDGPYRYSDSHLDRPTPPGTESWQSWLTRDDEATQGDGFGALLRPARSTMEVLEGDGPAEDLGVRVEPGGTAFIDLAPEADLQGDLDLSIEIDDPGHIEKYRFSTVAYRDSTTPGIASGLPAVCRRFGAPVLDTVASEEGSFVLRVQIDEACRTATLAITNIDPHSGDDDGDEFVISAEFNGTAPLSGIDLVSVDSAEHQGNGPSGQASIAPGGGSVVFASAATNLVAGDVGDGTEIYRRSLPGVYEDGTTVLVSGGDDDAVEDDSGYPVVSSDGQVVAFASLDDDLDLSGEPSDGAQVYVADLDEDTIDRVSLFTPQAGQVAAAGRPSISADGRYIAYEGGGYTGLERPGSPSGVSAIYLYDREADTTICVSCVSGAVTSQSFDADIDVDGSVVVFSSAAAGLVAGDTNGIADVFAYDIATGTHARRSVNDEGAQATVASTNPHGGSGTAYQQGSDVHAVRSPDINVFADKELIDLAGSGWAMTYADGDDVHQACPFATSDPASLAIGIGGPPNGATAGGSLTLNGFKTAFESTADNLVGGDVNNTTDVFVTSSTSCAEG